MKYIRTKYSNLRKHYFGSFTMLQEFHDILQLFLFIWRKWMGFLFLCYIWFKVIFFAVLLVQNQLNQVSIVRYAFQGIHVPKYSPSFIDNYRVSHRGVWVGLFHIIQEAGKNILLNEWFTQKWQLYSHSYCSKPVWVLKQQNRKYFN